jgi:hypothetical protein
MGLTDHCNIFASFAEDGFNRIIGHVRRQRPSLFNYATEFIAQNPGLLCKPELDVHPIVSIRNNPLVTIVDPLPIPGTNFGVNFCVQLVDLQIDFHPTSLFNLPSELNLSLEEQRLAIKLTLCAGIGCPPDDILGQFITPPRLPRKKDPQEEREAERPREKEPIRPLPTRELICFCLEAYITGGVRIPTYNGMPYLEPFLDGFEIVDIEPRELEDSLECYIGLMLKLAVLPGLRILLKHAPLNLTQGATDFFPQPTNVVISPTPISGDLPNNPAIEKDLLKAFINVEVI